MSQRWVPPPRDNRDRSPPPRPFDRRGSSTYTPTQSQTYRPSNDSTPSSIDRAPPRGPRADSYRGAYSSTPRGRGGSFAPRGGDSWDRDRDRDPRVQSSTFRRDEDRSEWPRRDERPAFRGDRSYVSNQSRERSASPRPRRDSKEAIVTPYNRGIESAFGITARGGSDRGRGRGGWDRSRGRSSFVDRERELFPNRSRSRDAYREYDRPRNFGPDADRGDRFDRRDYDRSLDRDPRPRDHDVWQRDPSPGRSSTGGRGTSPGALSSISQDRKFDHDLIRKPLTASNLPARREPDDYFGARAEVPRREPQPPPAPPQSASLGLDYGPPPSAPAPTPPAPAPVERLQYPPRSSKPEPAPAPATFQPPSGPKADRSAAAPMLGIAQRPNHQSDTRSKPEGLTRLSPEITKDVLNEAPRGSAADPRSERSSSTPAQGDRAMPPHVPSGPRLSATMPYKPKLSPVAQHTPLPPVQPKALGNESRSIPNVPTGPRSSSILPPSGPRANVPTGPAGSQAGPAPTWRRPQIEYRPQKPSIMGGMNRSQMLERSAPTAHLATKHSPTMMSRQMSGGQKLSSSAIAGSVRATSPMTDVKQEPAPAVDVEMSAPASEDDSDGEDDDEPESELDENYFEDSEKTHAREMDRLKSQMPLPLLEDSHVVRLLFRIQLLGMIAEGLVPEGIHVTRGSNDVEMADQTHEGLPSPDDSPDDKPSPELEHLRPRGRPLKAAPINPIPTPPIEELPYLHTRPEGVVTFDEPLEDDVEEEKMTTLLRTQFEQEAWEERDDLQELSGFYKQKFPEWKYEIDKFERLRRDIEGTPDPGSPGAQSVASLPQTVERLTGRAARNATDFDIEKAILMSQQSAREEEERREREAAQNAGPNYETEALVPDMLKPTERDSTWKFQDTNRIVPTDLAVDLMQYIPPEDDFTTEEQAKFITAFCQTPKKWGQIADQIPGRSYQECILHYYLTKMEANYKELWRRAQPKKRGRRTATKARANALMSDLALNEDPENAPLPMTDSGRPRRAAAPTFGDIPDTEAVNMPAAKRLAATPKDATEIPVPKPKGRKAGAAAKPRRTKAQIEADKLAAQGLVPQISADGSPAKGRARPLMRAEQPKVDSLMPIAPVVDASQLVQGQPAAVLAQMRARSPSQPTVTSYWSVPEQQKFRQLVAYYGRDYGKIADFMKTKSQAMIKNHYSREIQKGDAELEQFAIVAEEKIARGESLGRLPSPVAPAKRKYDPMPPIAASGQPAVGSGGALIDTDRGPTAAKPSVVDDFPANTIHRDLNGGLVAKASPRDALLQHNSPRIMAVQPKLEDYSRDRPLLTQKPATSGPPIGRFNDDPIWKDPYRGLTIGPDALPHHHPPTLVELRGGDLPRELTSAERRAMYERELAERERRRHPLGAPRIGWDAPLPRDIPHEPYQSHSRNTSNAGLPTTLADQHADLLRMSERSRFGISTTQSPRTQPVQAGVREQFSSFGQSSQQPFPPQQRSPTKQDQPKPAPAKRSALFDLLNNDEPERPAKRSSTDSARPLLQTPPPQAVTQAQQPIQPAYASRMQEDLLQRSALYNGAGQHINDGRASLSNSPAPLHRGESWMDRFDPRPMNDRANNQSPLLTMPPASAAGRSMGDGLRALDRPSRFSDLRREQINSPSRPIATPVPHARSATAAPQQHSRMTSTGFDHFGPEPGRHDYRSMQNQQQSSQYGQQPHLQPNVSHAQSASGTPVSSLHNRGQPSQEFDPRDPRRHQEYKRVAEYQRDPRDMGIDVRPFREDIAPRGQDHHRSIAQPPQHELLRQAERREIYRQDPGQQVPPPPRGTNISQLNPNFGAPPPRSYNNTPPAYGEPRAIAAAHNQHAHHHHHSLSAQGQQHQQHHQGHGMNLAPQPQGHQSIAPAHQQQPPYSQAPPQTFRDQPRFGQQQPLSVHYRNYSQGGDDRR